ncbi:Glyoxylase, beta-lactamase superfamily II [Mesobacillus persicus]|uniref:Glyoxylase, beta-lactamase superfamily II n=1 Tax=Mesobacillus persicus TaxID=930146 RepID=A0A1H8H3H5_9BACI|nr:MBL fold metallo-hydrolase [Mesobacillus persicus]SEN50028.1 Glyoxylase, beta-lactamase superfamily II [Mesobacillus persicus]
MQTIEKIGERFWYQTPVSETDRPVLGMVVGDNKTLMIDAGNSEAHAQYFLEELAKRNVPKPDILALTHWHWDHIFGLSSLTEVVSIAQVETKEAMEKLIPLSWSDEALDERVQEGTEIEFCSTAIKKEFPHHRNIVIALPEVTFDDRIEVDVGGVTCVLQHVGGDHASDSVVIFVKEEKILFLGDSIYANIFASKTNYTVGKIRRLLDTLETFNEAETYVLSHSGTLTREEFNAEAALFRAIANYTEEYRGDASKIKQAYEKQIGRTLNEDELETVEYFVNGWSIG